MKAFKALSAALACAGCAHAADSGAKSVVYGELWAGAALERGSAYDVRRTQDLDNPRGEDSMSYQSDSWGAVVGSQHPIGPGLSLGPRVGYGRVIAIRGGPRVDGVDVGVMPRFALPLYRRPEQDREFALGLSTPVSLTLPLATAEPEAGRAVEQQIHVEIGWAVGARLEALWRWRRSSLSVGAFLNNRWTPFSQTSTLRSDPSVRDTQSYSGQHGTIGWLAGYGWCL